MADPRNETLGVKHKNYNKRVKDAIAEGKSLDETEFKPGEEDLENLIKIDLACNKRNIDYILSVLKSKDMLYVSRALGNSKWLVEDQYAHIINPQHLHDQLFPKMTTEAGIKLTKLIRQHLRNETRAEEFLKSETDPKLAAKWLSRCSIPFIEKNIDTYKSYLEAIELKRLWEKSVTIFDAAIQTDDHFMRGIMLRSGLFLINTHLEKYLDAVEMVNKNERPNFNAKATNKIMKQFSERIKEKFEIYAALIHITTFVKYFKSDEIKGFLYKQANEHSTSKRPPRFFKYTAMKQFVLKMPKEEQYDFVKTMFIDSGALLVLEEDTLVRGSEIFYSRALCKAVCAVTPSYFWYEFAPFEVAFAEIKKLIDSEIPNAREKSSLLRVLLTCTAGDMKRLQTVFTFYFAQRIKDEVTEKIDFISNVIACTDIREYDDATWNLLDKILINMEVYVETANTQQNCLEIVIIRHLLLDKPIPEAVEKKFSFYTLHNYQKKLSKEDGNKLFDYLYNHAKKLIDNNDMSSQEEFTKVFTWLNYLLNLLFDWNKALTDYLYILEKIREFIKIKKDNNWKADLAELYNKNKSWRKHMFEESVILSPTEATCVNAIKHDPALLERFKDEVETICCNDAVSLGKLLDKLRVYWPHSLADDWSKSYVARLNKLGNHKALVRGICAILPPSELNDIIKKYAPQEAKIDWSKTDEISLSLQRLIAKNMHFARPQPSPEDVLLYAKGDYLQYALPSLLSIYYNLNRVESKEQVPKLLDAPVSLQKHGLRLAFIKLDHSELKLHMSNVWNVSKNSTIRTVVFQLMFQLLRKEKNEEKARELWELLQMFIDNLSYQEDDKIYDLLPRASDIPLCVRPMFLMKSYKFMKNLIKNTKKSRDQYQYHADRMAEYTRDIMELIPPEFVYDIVSEFVNEKLFVFDKYQSDVRSGSGMLPVMSAYLLCTKDEDTQMQRYEKLVTYILKRSFDMWNETCEGNYFMRHHFQQILDCLLSDLNNYVIKNKMVIPTKMYSKIENKLQSLNVSENYVMLTMWKLTVRLTEMMEKSNEKDDWDKICAEIAPAFAKFCLDFLKEEVNLYFPCIYVLYSKALQKVIEDFPSESKLQIFKCMLSDSDFIQAYLATMKVLPRCGGGDEISKKKQELKNMIRDHPSPEVKLHYYNNFKVNC